VRNVDPGKLPMASDIGEAARPRSTITASSG